MRRLLAASAAALSLSMTSAVASTEFPAKLVGHAILPAETFIQPPADAPVDLKVSGRFTNVARAEGMGTVMGRSNGRPTGLRVPFFGQPVQGHSGIKRMRDGTFWVLTDNGFGSKLNSPDAMLFVRRYNIDWGRGAMDALETVWLHDPDSKVPFRIANEGTAKRYLTGSDLDLEGFQPIGDKLWFGDEFGPYLIRTDRSGKVEAVFESQVDGKPLRSPDHFRVAASNPGAPTDPTVNLGRSRGYEGMAASPDGTFIYGLLEGPVWDVEKKDWEKTAEGRTVLRILEFSVTEEKWTGRHWKYVLEPGATAIGDFNMIDATTALVIERDNGEGTPDKACPAGQRAETCFHDLAKFKRVVKIEMTDANANAPVRKIGHIDLMKLADPDKRARKPLNDGVLTFPFFTIENVDVVDGKHIIVGNDNNLPFSSSREPNKADDNEMVLLDVEALLKAR
ncbi:MAG: esterase-like activity of phytase family protein [Hyphomicrobiales bacterium]|jgi:hypothetical protein|nr:esterase-like activity of phytase family protein [Hyphomicrobiales bacterium]